MKRARALQYVAIALLCSTFAGDVGATEDYAAGVAAAKAGEFERAHAIWLPLAEEGHAASQFNVGMLHARGEGVGQDYAEAARWFRKAAEQGQVEAQAHLGGMYARGLGVEQDYRAAAGWLFRAAEQHHRQSQYELATLYANGQGMQRDFAMAYFWFTLAVLQNYPPALEARNKLLPHMHPTETILIEQQVQDWLQKNEPAADKSLKTP